MNPEDVVLPPHRSVSIPLGGDAGVTARASRQPSFDTIERTPEEPLSAAYRKLLRWYPREWRASNEDAMLGILLDVAQNAGRSAPTWSDAARLMAAGLSKRFGFLPRGQRLRLIPLAFGAALSVFYALFIIWAPATHYTGSIGPFSNPSIVTCVLLVAAFLAALFLRGRTAGALALIAAGVEIAIGSLSAGYGWQGPGGAAVALFVGIALVSGGLVRGGVSFVIGALLVAAATGAALIVSWVAAAMGHFTMVATIAAGAVMVLVIGAAVLGARKLRRRSA
jgi:hypothetical protein